MDNNIIYFWVIPGWFIRFYILLLINVRKAQIVFSGAKRETRVILRIDH
jgi:hypothetical protein